MNQLPHYGNIHAWQHLLAVARTTADLRRLKPIHSIFLTAGHSLTLTLRHRPAADTTTPFADCFACNALLIGYSRSREPRLALRCFKLMLRSPHGVADPWTFNSALLASVNGPSFPEGEQIHGLAVKNGLASLDARFMTGLIRFYATCKDIDSARNVFDEIPHLDVFHCNALMNGYVECGLASEALSVFWDMLECGLDPDEHCTTTAVKACAHLGALSNGVRIHEYVKKRTRFGSGWVLNAALVDMYAKCGSLDAAVEVFEKMRVRNVSAWTAMISAFTLHGHVSKAAHCLESMRLFDDRVSPGDAALLAMLRGYNKAGLVEESRDLLLDMEIRYRVSPKHEHYQCVVDLLSRVGRLNDAYEVIGTMPMKPLASVWGALLRGCQLYNSVELAELAINELEVLDSKDKAGDYARLSEIYLAAGRSEDAARVREMVGDIVAEKPRGSSSIEVDGKVDEFSSGFPVHSLRAQMVEVLDLISTCSMWDKPTYFTEDWDSESCLAFYC